MHSQGCMGSCCKAVAKTRRYLLRNILSETCSKLLNNLQKRQNDGSPNGGVDYIKNGILCLRLTSIFHM